MAEELKPCAPYDAAGVGTKLFDAAEAYLKDEYVFSPEEFVADHELTEMERLMFEDFLGGLGGDPKFSGIIAKLQYAVNESARLQAENERLRKALQAIDRRCPIDKPDDETEALNAQGGGAAGWRSSRPEYEIGLIARTALSGEASK